MHSWILLADDDPEDKFIIQDAMERLHGPELLHFVENGEQVLDHLTHHISYPHLPCLIVLDLNMPRKNGTQTLRELKADERYQSIPVIIYSTSINPIEMEKCMQLGAHSYVTKPISVKDSLETASLFFRFCQQGVTRSLR